MLVVELAHLTGKMGMPRRLQIVGKRGGSFYASTELAYVIVFILFIAVMFIRPEGLFQRRA